MPVVQDFPLEEANQALVMLEERRMRGAGLVRMTVQGIVRYRGR